MNRWLSGEWIVDRTDAKHRRVIHYWLTIVWLTLGSVVWIVERDALWFVGFMSLYAIWISHLAGWAAETPVEGEDSATGGASGELPRLGPRRRPSRAPRMISGQGQENGPRREARAHNPCVHRVAATDRERRSNASFNTPAHD